MNEYRIIGRIGFETKEWYVSAESAQEVQEYLDESLAFELADGLSYTIEKL